MAFAVFLPAQAARPDSPPQCQIFNGNTFGPPGLSLNVFTIVIHNVPEGVGNVSGTAPVSTFPGWNILFNNTSGATVTDPTIAISSALDPADFDGALFGSCSQPSLDTSSTMHAGLSAPGASSDVSLGYDSSTSASPSLIPDGGGEVTEQFSVTLTNPLYADGTIHLSTGNGGVFVVSQSIPQNLDQGEAITTDGNEWDLQHAVVDKTYHFDAVVDVSTPPGTGPYLFNGTGYIQVGYPGNCSPCGVRTTGSSVTIPDASLQGTVTATVADAGQAWAAYHETIVQTTYPDGLTPFTAAQCKRGGWLAYGVFKNQGDCVSFAATGGRNAP